MSGKIRQVIINNISLKKFLKLYVENLRSDSIHNSTQTLNEDSKRCVAPRLKVV